jgi:RNA polymerase sigma-70 factor (ECF subfamily)
MASPVTTQDSAHACSPQFVDTHWSVVLKAARQDSPGAAEALERLCRTYRYPLYAFIRRRGHNHHDAEDLTQEFFARLLDKNYLKNITMEGGKFRSYLLTLLKHFLANEWNRERTQKRGDGKPLLSIDDKEAETRYACEPADYSTPEALYDRRWAMALLDLVMNRLRAERIAAGKGELFEALRGHLTGADKSVPYAEIGARLGMSEGAVKKAKLDLTRRYGRLLWAEIAATVSSPEEVEEEIQYLIAVMSR